MATTRRTTIGRPREFDIDDALERAMRVFWAQGYEGASLADLTAAMGVTRTSLYIAFGSKQELFRRALDLYAAGPASYAPRALTRPSARDVASTFLHGAVEATTAPGHPHGCLGVQGALVAAPDDRTVTDLLARWREDVHADLAARLRRARVEGDLPPTSDPESLALLLMTVANGIAVQAAGGQAPEALRRVVETIMQTWPSP